jgi:hypothetical protein
VQNVQALEKRVARLEFLVKELQGAGVRGSG